MEPELSTQGKQLNSKHTILPLLKNIQTKPAIHTQNHKYIYTYFLGILSGLKLNQETGIKTNDFFPPEFIDFLLGKATSEAESIQIKAFWPKYFLDITANEEEAMEALVSEFEKFLDTRQG